MVRTDVSQLDEESRLFAELYGPLRRFAAVVGPAEVDPDDLLQEAVARVFRRGHLTDLDEPAATPQSPFGATAAIEDVASYGGRFVAIGGTSQPEETAVWVSDDGVGWQRADVPRLGWARGIAGGELGWFLSGVESGSSDSSFGVDMWFSADGVTWDGPYEGPEDLSWFYFRTEASVGSDAIYSVNGSHDGLVIGRLQE